MPQLFEVILNNDDKQETIGRVEADSNSQLKVIAALDAHRQFLTETLQRVNEKDSLHVKIVPPADAPQFAVYTREVKRTEACFLSELQRHLQSYYDLTLRPTAGQ